MAGKTNMDKVRETTEAVKQGSSKSKNYKWKEGMNRLRICPPPSGEDEPWRKVTINFGVGPNKKTLVGPRQYGLDPDPLADHLDSLARKKDRASKDELKAIKPSQRFKVVVIDRDSEGEGAQIADFNVMAIKDVLKFFSDPEYGDLSDPEEGRDLKITHVPAKKSKNGFPQFDVVPAAKVTPLRPKDWDDEDYESLLETNWFEESRVGYPNTPEYIQAVLDGEDDKYQGPRMQRPNGEPVNAAAGEDEDEDADEAPPAKPAKAAVKAPAKPVKKAAPVVEEEPEEEPADEEPAEEQEAEEPAEEEPSDEDADAEAEAEAQAVAAAKAKKAAPPKAGKSVADQVREKLKAGAK